MDFKALPKELKNWSIFWTRYDLSIIEDFLNAFRGVTVPILLGIVLALYDVHHTVPPFLHFLILLALGTSLAISIQTGIRTFRMPSPQAILRRLEQENKLPYGPLQTLVHQLPEQTEKSTHDLWRAHRGQQEVNLKRFHVGRFVNPLVLADRYGLVFILIILSVIGGISADNRMEKITGFWTLHPAALSAPQALPKIYVEMPAYLNSKTILLNPKAPQKITEIPQGSYFVLDKIPADQNIRIYVDYKEMPMTTSGQSSSVKIDEAGDHLIRVFAGWQQIAAWSVDVVQDQPPQIAFADDPYTTQRDSLAISSTVLDDFGISQVYLHVKNAEKGFEESFPLSLPRQLVKEGTFTGYQNLSHTILAGQMAEVYLTAMDGKGQTSRSASLQLEIPEKEFTSKPAKKLVEIRKRLIEEGQIYRSEAWFDVSQVGLEKDVKEKPIPGMGLRVASQRLYLDGNGAYLNDSIALLWDVAVDLEDGGASSLERQLQDLEEQIKDAIRTGQSPEQIAFLLQKYKRMLAEFIRFQLSQMQQGQQPNSLGGESGSYGVEAGDLLNFVDYMEKLAQNGQYDDLSKMFSQLQNILENMQQQQPMSEEAKQAFELIKKVQETIDNQNAVLQKTFPLSKKEVTKESKPDLLSKGQAITPEQKNITADIESIATQLMQILPVPPPPEFIAAHDLSEISEKLLDEADFKPATKTQAQIIANLEKALKDLSQAAQQMFGSANQQSYGLPGAERYQDNTIEIPNKNELNEVDLMIQDLRSKISDPDLPEMENKYYRNLLDFF